MTSSRTLPHEVSLSGDVLLLTRKRDKRSSVCNSDWAIDPRLILLRQSCSFRHQKQID
jgi:hypothetical protein